ncbi:MAG: alpha-glucan family phosphorylase [Rikenellaceae bacterium]
MENIIYPNYLFETSWEVCNKVGGINTVIITKARLAKKKLGDNYILIGPDIHRGGVIPDFDELPEFNNFREYARANGIRIRVGRWKLADGTITILVDFSHLVATKDEILSELWNDYKIDSISGQWDYIEPVLFGYATGYFIKKLSATRTHNNETVVAHFHEWMTASGALYLKKYAPNIVTVFTTHATIIGRTLAGNGYKLYSDIDKFDSDKLAKDLGIEAKYSMEKISAHECTAFATVSGVTKRECENLLGATVDMVTPNGFNKDFTWSGNDLLSRQSKARRKLIEVAEKCLNRKYETEPFIIGTSGRYEFYNKGIDVFIDALKEIAEQGGNKREVLAYITVPAGNNGVRDFSKYEQEIPNVTHYLSDWNNDPIVQAVRNSKLISNRSNVQIIFVPAYISENDGLFNMSYYELLIGMQQTVYASYYEPWGYTPMESIAYGIPTITTSLAGFGLWVKEHFTDNASVDVIERNDNNRATVVEEVTKAIIRVMKCSSKNYELLSANALEITDDLLWDKLIIYYWRLYSTAIAKDSKRVIYDIATHATKSPSELIEATLKPTWRRIMIERDVPEKLNKLDKIAKNLWWSWNTGGSELFRYMSPEKWDKYGKNPVALLHNLEYSRFMELENDANFCTMLDSFYNKFKTYIERPYDKKSPKIAYFSMEYGLVNFLKIYSGGLGILAGDYLKEASDKNVNMVAVGLMYKYGYFTQKISASGAQEAFYEAENFQRLPISPVRDKNGNWLGVTLPFPGRSVEAKIWLCEVGKTKLYLLDTDHTGNLEEDRNITHQLYGGNWNDRLEQEIVLGFGGMKALDLLDIDADVYHCNEGHAAFIGIERIKNIMNDHHLNFYEAKEVVHSSSLFTTHTPVPAGHDAFSEEMIRSYLSNIPEELGISWRQFLGLGMINPDDHNEKFSMSYLACSLSQEINGVSMLHGEVSKEILSQRWLGYFPSEMHIGYVTNGVHYPTWASKETKEIYCKAYGDGFEDGNYKKIKWSNIYKVDDKEIWNARLSQKQALIGTIKKRLSDPQQFRFDSPRQLVQVKDSLRTDVLTIGFARRFATYKRPMLLFDNLDRLAKIVNNPERPVQILFAGKAHPNDIPGQELIKKIVSIASMPQFLGKIIFLQNYDMRLSKKLVSGVDVWLNTPERPLEASGTSGEKAAINGTLHFSVLDGWWVEGYKEGAGWSLPQKPTFEDHSHQNEVDSEMIYNIIEEQIAPLYYSRNENNIPIDWVQSVKKCICEIASEFNTGRMMQDYEDKYYKKLHDRKNFMVANNFAKTRELAAWKDRVHREWNNVKVLNVTQYDIFKAGIKEGDTYKTEVIMDLGAIQPQDIGVEVVMARQIINGKVDIIRTIEFDFKEEKDHIAVFHKEFKLDNNGSFDISIRIFAKNPLMAYRMDFGIIKWI